MAAYSFKNDFSSGFFDPFAHDLSPCNGSSLGGSVSGSQSLVLDSDKGELVKTPAKVGKKSQSEEKVLAALKSHSEAERRRRERINAHLDTLRSLLPCREKDDNDWLGGAINSCSAMDPLQMDKATLLGEAVRQVKELKKNAIEASKGLLVPTDDDELMVEPCVYAEAKGTFCFKASICCEYRPDLLTDIRQALDALPVKMVKAEISTLGSRLKNDLVFTAHVDDAEARRVLASSIQQALNSVLEKASASLEFSPCLTFPTKRRRISYFDSSSSSS